MSRLRRARAKRAILVPALAVIALGVHAAVATGLRSGEVGSRTADATRLACPARELSVALGPQVVPFTGEHAIVIVIANEGRRTCLLGGYPAVVILARKRVLPFSYDDGGGPYLVKSTPRVLTLRRGDHAAFVVAKYRCDAGQLAIATAIDVWLPGVPGSKTLRLTGQGVGTLALCRKFKATGPPDPGNTVALSPLEFGRYAR